MLLRSLALLLCAGYAFAAPALTFSTYLRDAFTPTATATDSVGNVYVAGTLIIDNV